MMLLWTPLLRLTPELCHPDGRLRLTCLPEQLGCGPAAWLRPSTQVDSLGPCWQGSQAAQKAVFVDLLCSELQVTESARWGPKQGLDVDFSPGAQGF